jgi:predicted ATP-dependent protease
MGYLSTKFNLIRPGSIHHANGGFLVLTVEDLFSNPFVWTSMKRILKEGKIEIEDTPEPMEHIATRVLMPEPIRFNGKVIVLGDPVSYYKMVQIDPDFSDLFKVKADFDSTTEWTESATKKYSSFVSTICKTNDLKPMEASAVARIIEYCSRLASDQTKLSTRFGLITDLIFEVDYYCTLDGKSVCNESHVRQALEKQIYRSNLYQEKINEMISRGVLLIDIQGGKVGQINGLAIIGLENFSFGRPSRVTATVGVGRKGVIDIERESQLGGSLHTKGVHIISGFLNETYAQNIPLSLTARLVFEQNYSGVDGDSASSTELYSILSALTGIPIKQNIAVTGSLNQKGEVQAIGGVNEKIEGFYEICKTNGLTGDQGVMIPSSNVENLMLKEEVVEAMKQELFHVYSVSHVKEGIEILTGIKYGEKTDQEEFEENSINWLVQKRLKELAEKVKEYEK